MQTTVWALLLAVLTLGAGCASTIGAAAVNQQMAGAEMAIRRAEREGAGQTAPALLTSAREALDAGRQAGIAGERERARERFMEAEAYAQAAESRAIANQVETKSAEMARQADGLEARSRELRSRAR